MRNPGAQIVGLLATTAAFVAAPAAGAETLVPPGNSAATQYTEAFPTTGGDRETDKFDNGSRVSLDPARAKRLEEKGPAGRAVAEIVATTAPSPAVPATEGGSQSGGGNRGMTPGTKPQSSSGVNRHTDAGSSGGQRDADGSSGLSEVIEQATGSSTSGEMGLFLPLLILAALAWSVAFLWRRRSDA